MSAFRPVLLHGGLLVVAGLAASLAWSKEKTPLGIQETNATVWGGRAADVESIVYETKTKKVDLVSREEKKGDRWFLGKVTNLPIPPAEDGGAPVAPSPPVTFASSTPASKLADAFAPFKALRGLGKLPEGRAAEFGLDKRDTTLTVTVNGKAHKLVIGATAPGGSDSYVLDTSENELYVMKGDPVRDLEAGETRLIEHDQHAFKETETSAAKVTVGTKTRELVRGGPDNKKFWADPANRDKADETAGNWLQKVERLRVLEYAEKPPENRSVIVRVDYTGPSGTLGFFELLKTPAKAEGQKPDYWIMTEHTHLYGKVFQSAGEQVEQDVGSVVK